MLRLAAPLCLGLLLTALPAAGGRIAPAANGAPATIQGGVTQAVKKGDAIVVPPNTPHQYVSVQGAVTTLEVRFVDAPPPT